MADLPPNLKDFIAFGIISDHELEFASGRANTGSVFYHSIGFKIFMQLQEKYGGTVGDLITDALRFYKWYIFNKDRNRLLKQPYDAPPIPDEVLERYQISHVELTV